MSGRKSTPAGLLMVDVLLGLVGVFGVMVAIGQLLFGSTAAGGTLLAVALGALFIVGRSPRNTRAR